MFVCSYTYISFMTGKQCTIPVESQVGIQTKRNNTNKYLWCRYVAKALYAFRDESECSGHNRALKTSTQT